MAGDTKHYRDMAGPATQAVAVTPHDTNTFEYCRALYVGGTGNMKVRMLSGDDVTFSTIPAGTVLAIQCDRVYSTGTTATTIVRMH